MIRYEASTVPSDAGFRLKLRATPLRLTAFFFFQAEDGIRDYKVTGVQTWLFRSGYLNESELFLSNSWATDRSRASLGYLVRNLRMTITELNEKKTAEAAKLQRISEERRVGKECRSRWSPYH